MPRPVLSSYRPARIAGGILVLVAILDYFQLGRVSAVSFVLGLSLLLIQDSSKLELARFIVFGWLVVSVLLVLPAALYEGMWEHAVRNALFCGALIGLMLERLREPVVAVLCLVAVGIIYW